MKTPRSEGFHEQWFNGGGAKITQLEAIRRLALALLFTGVLLVTWESFALSQNIRSKEEIVGVLVLDKVEVQTGVVSGEIHNRSSRIVRDVQLFIRHTWLWNDEFKPGKDDPGMSAYHTVSGEIPPGGATRFKFAPIPPLPKLSTGHFETTVSIAGFTEVIPQSR